MSKCLLQNFKILYCFPCVDYLYLDYYNKKHWPVKDVLYMNMQVTILLDDFTNTNGATAVRLDCQLVASTANLLPRLPTCCLDCQLVASTANLLPRLPTCCLDCQLVASIAWLKHVKVLFWIFVKISSTLASAGSCFIAALPGVKYSGLFCLNLERCKNLALKSAKGNFEKPWD